MGIKEQEEGKKGELIAYRKLVELKESFFKYLGIDSSYDIYFASKENEEFALDVKTIISNDLQRKLGIDILVGRYIDDFTFESFLTIDVKYVTNIYLELFGSMTMKVEHEVIRDKETNKPIEYLRVKNEETGELEPPVLLSRKIKIDNTNLNYPKSHDLNLFDLLKGELTKINNNYAQAYIFVSKSTNKVLGKPPLFFTNDIEQALKLGFLIGDPYKPSWLKEIFKDSCITGGNRRDRTFYSDTKFFAGIKAYKDSIIKEPVEPQSGVSENIKPEFIITNTGWEYVEAKQGGKDITVKIKVRKTPFLIVHEEGQEVVNIKTSDIK